MMNMKPFYTEGCLEWAIFFSKISTNFLIIIIVYNLSAKFVTVYEGHAVGILVIYFICAYEFILNVLVTLGRILDLDTIDSNSKSNGSNGDFDFGFGGNSG